MSAETHTLTLSDSRCLAWCEYGSPTSNNPPVIYFHSFPSSRYEGSLWHSLAVEHDLRIISPDRPGMGLSSPDPNRTFLCYPADILELAKHLGISQFQVLSVSGGGPYAFACLKAIPRSMCIGGQIVSSIYPLSFGTNGMSFMHRSIMFLSYWAPGFVGTLMDWQIGSAARNPDRNVLKESLMKSMKYMPKRDQEALEQDDYLAALMDALRESFRDGGAGMGVESYLFAKDWGFELGDIDEHDIGLWHGKLDINCPFGMAQHAAGLLKASETHFLEEEAHSLASFHKDEILRSFLSSFT